MILLYRTLAKGEIYLETVDFTDAGSFEEFDKFVRGYGEFMQSPRWASVKDGWIGEGIISRNCEGNIRAACLVLVYRTPLISLLYAPRGFIGEYSESAFSDIMAGIDLLAKKYRAAEFLFDPKFTRENEPMFLRGYRGFEITPVQPRENVILRLKKTYAETERGFKSDYRNRIHKAKNRGVRFEIHGENALGEFYALYRETGKRDGFQTREREYFSRMLSAFGDDCRVFICRSENGKALSAAVGIRFGTRFTYVYGASSSENRELYPCYLMHSEMIKFALESGCTEYDFGGVPNYRDESSAGYRLWRFKHGFGGETVEFVGEYSKVYRKYPAKLVEFIQKAKRNPCFTGYRTNVKVRRSA